MWVSKSNELVLVLPPKTGTHSLRAMFKRAFPDARRYGGDHFFPDPWEMETFADFTWVVAVRNPFPRAVSYYMMNRGCAIGHLAKNEDLFSVNNKRPFVLGRDPLIWVKYEFHELMLYADWRDWEEREFLSLKHWIHKSPKVNYYLRLEHLEDDIQALPYPEFRAQPMERQFTQIYTKPWFIHYTPDAEQAVREICAYDFAELADFYTPNLIDSIPADKHAVWHNYLDLIA